MKLLLIGQSVLDTIIDSEKKTNKPGGIYYSGLGINAICNESDNIYLLTTMDNSSQYFENAFRKLDLSLVQKVMKIPRVQLTIFDNEEREEIYSEITRKINIKIESFPSDLNGILINMITGFEIDLKDLQEIRKSFQGLIYFDVHTLARGIDQNNKRFFRPIPDIKSWLSCTDIVQVNENEIRSIHKSEDQVEAANYILSCGPKILIVTKGENGVTAFWIQDGQLNYLNLPAQKTNVINKVGCGDIFGAIFFYSYIKSNKLVLSLNNANKAASIFTTMNVFNNLSSQIKEVCSFND